MFQSVSAHIEIIIRHNIFWKVVPDRIVYSEFTLDRILGCQQISNLNIELLRLLGYLSQPLPYRFFTIAQSWYIYTVRGNLYHKSLQKKDGRHHS